MSKNIIRFRTQEFFNPYFRFIGIVFIGLAVTLIFLNWIISPIFLILGILLSTTHYWIEINLDDRKLHDYLWISGFRKGEKIDITEIDYLYLTKSKYSREYGFFPRAYEYGYLYNGYSKLKNEEKLLIGYSKKKDSILRKLERISKELNLEIKDYSD
ncbi:hypothetical protein ACFLU5_04745 [Bacteroidota bacterium]